jgi:hypothetical protein
MALGAAGAGLAFAAIIRPWYLRWGATDDELTGPMPLDERVPSPNLSSTMAITIAAPPDEVWPWLVQVGDPPRAGYYSYTSLERLAGLHIENAGRILPEFQTVEVGQALDRNGTMVVQAVEPGRHLVLGPPESVDLLQCTWSFALRPAGDGLTRLIARVRARWSYRKMLRTTPPWTWPTWLLIEPGAFIMERKMLREIKRLAEASRDRSPANEPLVIDPALAPRDEVIIVAN